MKLGTAISVYSKINHLKTNINIIRNHWSNKENYFISVCCNDSKSFDNVKALNIDSFTTGNYEIKSEPKPFRRLRIFDCIRNSILNCNAEFIIHYHADAYALSSDKINLIIDKMINNNYHVAFRGKGLDYRNNKNIFGDVDDHFCIFNRQKLIESGMFNVNYESVLSFLHVGNPETLLSKLIQDNFDRKNIFQYSNMSENEVGTTRQDPFYSDNVMHRAMTPYNFDNERQFLHFGNEVTIDFISENLTSRGVQSNLIVL